ncbi:MAG TPA: DinB family protein [Ktedonobacteraceae bacterium]|nr:DinB family protein [Ktedonobacteraceae bacterium]
MKKIQKPAEGEYAPYAIMYIERLPDDGLVLQHMQTNIQDFKDLVSALPEGKLISRCAEGEWTIKEILVHVIDTERIFAYRALRFARNDTTPLAGYDQVDYASYSGANERSIEDILEEFTFVRQATLALFNSFGEEVFTRSGPANQHNISVRSLLYQMAGHELHHVASIKENYLSEK